MRILRHASHVLLLLSISLTALPLGHAHGEQAPTPADLAQDYLRDHPGGTLVSEHEVTYPDGSGFVAVEAGTYALSQCGSGQFCMWTATNYTGSFTYVTGSGVDRTLSGRVLSLWNNRNSAARLFNGAGTSSLCYTAGTKQASVPTAYRSPSKVFLSSSTSC